MSKKIILCVIDSLHPQALSDCFSRGWIPALNFLRNRGFYHKDCVSVFPTMTPTAAAAITTGTHPDAHGVRGFIWYDERERRIVNYGATPMAIYSIGVKTVLEELVYNLNGKHLNPQVPTIYEILSAAGISSACINFFIHRGKKQYRPALPFTLRLFSRFKWTDRLIQGPDELVLGRVVCPSWLDPAGAPATPWSKFGINDLFTGYALRQMIRQGRLPQFTLAYFPDTDAMAHDHGPLRTQKSLRRVDKQLASILDLYPSWDKALEELTFIIVGDHSQTLVGRSRRYLIDLQNILSDFTQLSLGATHSNELVAISPNERMAVLNFPQDLAVRDKVIKRLARDYRITQIMWKQGEEYRVVQGGRQAELVFKLGGPCWDRYGNSWSWDGDLRVVDMRLQGTQLVDGDYPDALYRIKTALDGNPGAVLLSAMPGYEFQGEHAPLHPGGGSHGSLHKEDSLVPLIIAGADRDIPNPRITSFVPYLEEYFNINTIFRPKAVNSK